MYYWGFSKISEKFERFVKYQTHAKVQVFGVCLFFQVGWTGL